MKWILFVSLSIVSLAACSPRKDQPIMPVRDYERMIVGRLDADYVGNEACLSKCHAHDKKRDNFNNSVHGEQIDADSGLPLVNCESCHGPGSLAVSQLKTTSSGEQQCDTETLLPISDLPAQAQSLICLKCHSASSSPNLVFWSNSSHASGEVSCFNCHKLHLGAEQKLSRHDMAETCYGCHQNVRNQFSQISHHPVNEHKMDCADCHNPHGSETKGMLRGATVKATCTRCHMEYQGPFVYEHADITEDCTNCHSPHGSSTNPLLVASQPFLCMQCHAGHHSSSGSARGTLSSMDMKEVFYNRCTDCHSSIHGTDIPSRHGRGTFISR